MPTIILQNPIIQQKQTYTQKDYFLIKDNQSSDNTFFAFEWTVKEGWQELVNNYQNIKEVEAEYYETDRYKKVISVYIPQEGEIFI